MSTRRASFEVAQVYEHLWTSTCDSVFSVPKNCAELTQRNMFQIWAITNQKSQICDCDAQTQMSFWNAPITSSPLFFATALPSCHCQHNCQCHCCACISPVVLPLFQTPSPSPFLPLSLLQVHYLTVICHIFILAYCFPSFPPDRRAAKARLRIFENTHFPRAQRHTSPP